MPTGFHRNLRRRLLLAAGGQQRHGHEHGGRSALRHFTAQRALAACTGQYARAALIAGTPISRLKTPTAIAVYSGHNQMRCELHPLLICRCGGGQCVYPQGGRPLHRKGTARAEQAVFPPAWAWATASRRDWKPDGEPPEGFEVRCQTARSQSFPTGKCRKCPAAAPPPAGREAPADGNPSGRQYPSDTTQLPNGRDKEKSERFAQAVCFLLSVRFLRHRLKTDDHAAALGIVAAKTTAGTDLNVCFRKCPLQQAASAPAASGFSAW